MSSKQKKRPDIENGRGEKTRGLSVQGIDYRVMMGVLFALCLTVLFASMARVTSDDTPPMGKRGNSTSGNSGDSNTLGAASDALRENSETVFIDQAAINLIYDYMLLVNDKCTPLNTDPILSTLQQGTSSQTHASWSAFKVYIEDDCNFYFLTFISQLAGESEGPSEICYSYVYAGLQAVEIFLGNNLPVDFYAKMQFLVSKAYPLNLYWAVGIATPYWTVASDVVGIASDFINSGNKDMSVYARRFCNKYFAKEDLDRYNPTLQPWLAFPFEGMLQRKSANLVPTVIRRVFGDLQISEVIGIKKVYAVGDSYTANNGAVLLVDTLLNGIPFQQIPGDISQALDVIKESLLIPGSGGIINRSMTPVLVIARYADDQLVFDAFSFEQNAVLFIFTNDDPGNLLQFDIGSQMTANAISAVSMSIFDVTNDHPFEDDFGPDYAAVKDTSDYINHLIGTVVSLYQTTTYNILNTFAYKNAVIDGIDRGGLLDEKQLLQDLDDQGLSRGFIEHSFEMDTSLQTYNLESANDDGISGDSLGGIIEPLLGAVPTSSSEIPDAWDWRKVNPECVPPVETQVSCNNCWGIASTNMINWRLCLKYKVPIEKRMSIQHVTSCSTIADRSGCEPQPASRGFGFMVGDVHSHPCMPRTVQSVADLGCLAKCEPGSSGTLEYVNGILPGSYASMFITDINAIKMEILRRGPITVGYRLSSQFLSTYPSGVQTTAVFNPPKGYTGPGHMNVLVGWGPGFFICENSHGTNRGDKGFVYITENAIIGAWTAQPRLGSIHVTDQTSQGVPIIEITAVPQTQTPASTPAGGGGSGNGGSTTKKKNVYTNPYGCPKVMLNSSQTEAAASIEGCPASFQRKVNKKIDGHGKTRVSNDSTAIRGYLQMWGKILLILISVYLIF